MKLTQIVASIFGASLLLAHPADATIIDVTFTGTVVSGSDNTGAFGELGRSLVGDAFTSMYVFDDTKGTVYKSPLLQQGYGGPEFGTTDPSLGADLTINGITFVVDGSQYGAVEDFAGGNEFTSYASGKQGYLQNILYSADLGPGLDAPFAASGISGGVVYNNAFLYNGAGLSYITMSVSNVNLAIAAAPEPSIWALMITGVGMAGAALRFGRRSGADAIARAPTT